LYFSKTNFLSTQAKLIGYLENISSYQTLFPGLAHKTAAFVGLSTMNPRCNIPNCFRNFTKPFT
jgi:hypothetical protein